MSNAIPSHVPPGLVRDFNYLDIGSETDAYMHFRKMHDGPDIFYSPYHEGHWVASRFEDMEAILMNREDFCSRYSSLPKHPFRLLLSESDGQEHADLRRIMQPFFTMTAIKAMESKARQITLDLIAEFKGRGECDFINEFAQKLPIIIMMDLLGLPREDTDFLLGLSEQIVRGSGDPVQRHELVENPERIPGALEELLRRHHLASIARMVNKDLEYRGIHFKAGDIVLIPTPAAAIDERRFPDAFTVDFDRKDKKLLTFGTGVHRCIGATLARTELRVFLQEWLQQFPDFRIKEGAIPAVSLGKVLAVRNLHLVW